MRYIRVKIISAYGKWSYFTLTQLKIKGKGLLADAFAELTKSKNSISEHHETKSQNLLDDHP